jgi:hypothetical protein
MASAQAGHWLCVLLCSIPPAWQNITHLIAKKRVREKCFAFQILTVKFQNAVKAVWIEVDAISI